MIRHKQVGALAVLAVMMATPALALRPPVAENLQTRVLAPAGFVATVAPVELSSVLDQVPADTLSTVAAFQAAAGPDWRFFVDRRSGGMALVEGQGIDWAHGGRLSLAALEIQARDLMQRYPALFRVPNDQLVLDSRGSVQLGEHGQLWNVAFKQVASGIPVDGARVVFRIAYGRLVQFGVDRTVPVGAPAKSPSGL